MADAVKQKWDTVCVNHHCVELTPKFIVYLEAGYGSGLDAKDHTVNSPCTSPRITRSGGVVVLYKCMCYISVCVLCNSVHLLRLNQNIVWHFMHDCLRKNINMILFGIFCTACLRENV